MLASEFGAGWENNQSLQDRVQNSDWVLGQIIAFIVTAIVVVAAEAFAAFQFGVSRCMCPLGFMDVLHLAHTVLFSPRAHIMFKWH